MTRWKLEHSFHFSHFSPFFTLPHLRHRDIRRKMDHENDEPPRPPLPPPGLTVTGLLRVVNIAVTLDPAARFTAP